MQAKNTKLHTSLVVEKFDNTVHVGRSLHVVKILIQRFQVQSPLVGCLVSAGVEVSAGSPNSQGRLSDVLLSPALLVEEALQDHVEGRPLVHGSSPA